MVILAFILLVLVGVVSFINTELMSINLYFTIISVPAWAVFIAFLLIGMLVAALFGTSKGARNRQVIKNKNKEIERAEEEKAEAINRVEIEKEQALERMKLEKTEAIEQMRKESDLQLTLQNKEAEIQKLESQIAKKDEKNTTMEKMSIQTEEPTTYMDEQEIDPFIDEEEDTGYTIDPVEKDRIED